MSSKLYTSRLKSHPESKNQSVSGIEARVCRIGGQALDIKYILKGDLTQLRIPTLASPHRTDRLWQRTCFEAFVSVKGEADYYEFNFAPSGEWAAYSFRRYRDGSALADDKFVPQITVHSEADRLDLDATIRLDRLPTITPHASLHMALCAVIEDQSGKLSYWALRHTPGDPDFHHPDCFALDLEPANVAGANETAMAKR